MDNERLTLDYLNYSDGIPPTFSASDMAILRRRAETAEVKHIPNKVVGIVPYDHKAYQFTLSYKRNDIPWSEMKKKQREWLWKIKDSLEGK